MEQLITDFMELSEGEKFFVTVASIYMVVTTIYVGILVYRARRDSFIFRNKKSGTSKTSSVTGKER